MTRKLLVAAFTLLSLSNINGQKMYEKDPGFLSSLIGDPVPSNGREYQNDKFIDVPSISLDYNRRQQLDNLPYKSGAFWYANNRDQDESLDDQRSNIQGNYLLDKRYENMEPMRMRAMRKRFGAKFARVFETPEAYFPVQRQRRNGKRGQLYLNHLARMNRK